MKMTIAPCAGLRGRVRPPGDKSLSHRALLLGAIADGPTSIRGFLQAGDTIATWRCLRALGVEVEQHSDTVLTVHGRGLHGLREPEDILDCQRSGTTMRLLAGLLSGQSFTTVLSGGAQLRRRPMERVTQPLRRMGATMLGRDGGRLPPLTIRGGNLQGIDHTLPVASAQVKSALLLASLYAEGPTIVRQPGPARDHTERLLVAMGGDLQTDGLAVTLHPGPLRPLPSPLTIPGDFSSAAFLVVAASLVPDSSLVVEGVGVNPTRTGLLEVLREMGAEVELSGQREVSGEPSADLQVRFSQLRGVEVEGDRVVRMIDEFPILAVAATQAVGQTVVRDAAELRVKETDRIATLVEELRRMGAEIEARSDGFVVQGPIRLQGDVVHSHGDHRLAMALVVAGLVATGETTVQGVDCIADSYPGFAAALARLGGLDYD